MAERQCVVQPELLGASSPPPVQVTWADLDLPFPFHKSKSVPRAQEETLY